MKLGNPQNKKLNNPISNSLWMEIRVSTPNVNRMSALKLTMDSVRSPITNLIYITIRGSMYNSINQKL